jgi:hypothetical protein
LISPGFGKKFTNHKVLATMWLVGIYRLLARDGGFPLKRFSSAFLVLALLAGCAPSPVEQEPITESIPEPATSPTVELSMFDTGCAALEDGTLTHSHLEVYRAILVDICMDFEMNYELVDVQMSEKVDKESADRYVDANVFGLSYWNRYVEG